MTDESLGIHSSSSQDTGSQSGTQSGYSEADEANLNFE